MIRAFLPGFGKHNIRMAGAIERLSEGLFKRAADFMKLTCVAVALAALPPDTVRAQTPGTGAISGVVLDPSGAAVGNAVVTVADQEIRIERSVATAADGSFRLSLLPLGAYSITVNATGFAQEDVPAVAVLASETTTVALRLKLGSGKTVIEVSEAVDLAQTQSATLGRALDDKKIVALPLANRNFSQILALSPGVVVGIPNAAAFGKNTQNVSVNGAKTTSNNFQFDGIDANNLSENSASGFAPEPGIAIPAPDTIAEFKVQTAMYDAGYGRSAGANVDVVTKSGSNRLHGELWEFFRNDALNANDFFLNQSAQPRPVLRQNQFGGTIGGPIRHDKTFFFGSYQGSLQTNGQAPGALASAFLPPLTDDRSAAALGQIFAGQTGAFGGVAVAPDGSNINPVALALLLLRLRRA